MPRPHRIEPLLGRIRQKPCLPRGGCEIKGLELSNSIMGIIADSAELLLECRQRGIPFGKMAMIGRQNVFISRPELKILLKRAGLAKDERLASSIEQSGDFAERFFEALGAETVDSIDASDFEGASLVHDLNRPIPEPWKERYDFVFDSGTLEHVFDFPRAILNCMQLVRVGGHLVLQLPANNFLGHGLYQFSPDLFFRTLTKANGFELTRMVASEFGFRVRRFEVVDPLVARSRGQVTNRFPIVLHLEAKKVASCPEVLSGVQQSDYSIRWEDHSAGGPANQKLADIHAGLNPALRRWAINTFPRLVRVLERVFGVYFSTGNSLRSRSNYRPRS